MKRCRDKPFCGATLAKGLFDELASRRSGERATELSKAEEDALQAPPDPKRKKIGKWDVEEWVSQQGGFQPAPLREFKQAEMYADNPNYQYIGRHPMRLVVVGPSGSGKSVWVTYALQFLGGWFDRVIVVSPNLRTDPQWSDIRLDPRDAHVDIEVDDLKEIVEEVTENARRQKLRSSMDKVLLVLDDLAHKREWMENPIVKAIFMQARHSGLSVWMCSQQYRRMLKAARINASDIVVFDLQNRIEVRDFTDEYKPHFLSDQEWTRLLLYIWNSDNDKGNYIHVRATLPLAGRYMYKTNQGVKPINVASYIDDRRAARCGLTETKAMLTRLYNEFWQVELAETIPSDTGPGIVDKVVVDDEEARRVVEDESEPDL